MNGATQKGRPQGAKTLRWMPYKEASRRQLTGGAAAILEFLTFFWGQLGVNHNLTMRQRYWNGYRANLRDKVNLRFDSDTSISRYLLELVECGYLIRYQPISLTRGEFGPMQLYPGPRAGRLVSGKEADIVQRDLKAKGLHNVVPQTKKAPRVQPEAYSSPEWMKTDPSAATDAQAEADTAIAEKPQPQPTLQDQVQALLPLKDKPQKTAAEIEANRARIKAQAARLADAETPEEAARAQAVRDGIDLHRQRE